MAEDSNDKKQVEIGFAGGGGIAVRISPGDYDSLRKALDAGGSWHELDTVDGPVSIDLRQVNFVKADAPEHKIGFSGL